jgi:hypothetical protein
MLTLVRLGLLTAAASVICSLIAPAAVAQITNCDKVLEGDLFNKVLSSTSQNSSAQSAAASYMFSLNEDEAYDKYQTLVESAKRQGQSVNAAANFLKFGGSVGVSLSYENALSKSQFNEQFRRAKAEYQNNSSNSSASQASLIDTYASYVRDTASVNAWKECVSKDRDTGIYTFGSRDASGKPSLNIIWNPGAFAATYPSVQAELDLEDGVTVPAATPSALRIGTGKTGKTFRVNASEELNKEGFSLAVNAGIKDTAGDELYSFSGQVYFPPFPPPQPPEPSSRLNGPIAVKYADIQNAECKLGNPTTDEADAPHGGRFNAFENGYIYWHPDLGVYSVCGPIAKRWVELGGADDFGYPITDQMSNTADGRGRYNHFRAIHVAGQPEASIYWTKETGAQPVRGNIRTIWARGGWERCGGYPKGPDYRYTPTNNSYISFVRQEFERGTATEGLRREVWISTSDGTRLCGGIVE